jgi:hypothetical protein
VLVIRFNPDAYVGYDGTKHPSCFDKEGAIAKKQQGQWKARTRALIRVIHHYADEATPLPPRQADRPCAMIELFYDDVDGVPAEVRKAAGKRRREAMGKAKKRTRDGATAIAEANARAEADPDPKRLCAPCE